MSVDLPDESLQSHVPKSMLRSICRMVGFDEEMTSEVTFNRTVVTVHHMDANYNEKTTYIRVK